MKKLISLVLALVMLAGVAAVGEGFADSYDITVWVAEEIKELTAQQIDAFNSNNQYGIKFNATIEAVSEAVAADKTVIEIKRFEVVDSLLDRRNDQVILFVYLFIIIPTIICLGKIFQHRPHNFCIMQIMLDTGDHHRIGTVFNHFKRFSVSFFIEVDDIIGQVIVDSIRQAEGCR